MERLRDSRPRSKRTQRDGINGTPFLSQRDETLAVRLTRKLAEVIDGVNLTNAHVGDRLELPQHDAEMLIAEGWAERAQAADRATRPRSPRLPSSGGKPRRKKQPTR
jgi:hypothetical protein